MFDKNFDFTGQLQNKSKGQGLWLVPAGSHPAQLTNIRYLIDQPTTKGEALNAFSADFDVSGWGQRYTTFKYDNEKDMQRIAGIINQIFPNDLHTKKEFDSLVASVEKLFKKEGQAPAFLPEPLAKLMETEKFKACKLPPDELHEAAASWTKAYFLIYKKIDAFIAGRLDGSIQPVGFKISMSPYVAKNGNTYTNTQYVKSDEVFTPLPPKADAEVETQTDDIPF